MFNRFNEAYSQLQPGDKMVMHVQKSAGPKQTQYQMPGAAGAFAGAGGAAGATGSSSDNGGALGVAPSAPMLAGPAAGVVQWHGWYRGWTWCCSERCIEHVAQRRRWC